MEDRRLTQDFDAHVPFTFAPIPESPAWANRWARTKRWFTIAFVESWLAILLFRCKVRLRAAHVPLLPGACDAVARALFRVQIGNSVEIGPGLMITHGNVVIDGATTIGRGCEINPWVTIGLSNSRRFGFSASGPVIGDYVHIGTGAKVLGPISVGDHVRIGANAVVIDDVPANVTVVGVPARIVGEQQAPHDIAAGSGNGHPVDGSGRDARLAAHMLQAIVDYRLRRQSLASLTGTLHGSFEIGSERLQAAGAAATAELTLLDIAAASDGGDAAQVLAALESINRRLAPLAGESQPPSSERS